LSKSAIARASGLLADGQLVAFPTETVYGLGADATNDRAVARIFAAKDRPAFNPLISHVASAAAAFDLGVETPIATVLASAFWPGPLTLVLDRRPDCPVARLTTAGLDKIAIRVPAHAAAQALLTHFGKPVAAPSANPSGRISPSTADHVMRGLAGKIDLVLDGGPCESGLESTVVDASTDQALILRPGGITRNAVADALKAAGFAGPIAGPIAGPTAVTQPVQPVAPGQLASHYAPRAAVRLNATKATADEELIGFGSVAGSGRLALSLSASGDLIEAAANLFAMLHRADDTGTAKIAIAPVPDNGLGEAINDRLRRAAAPRR
ncbi:MAG: threonylcarbamoyl-AMP synthase, partial [Alphaproteobacteria bacterium]|nr:threonylcarbamoyl-AMP synthase [Alphaproteobacteria bacterium]